MESCGSGRAKQWRMVMIALSLKFVMPLSLDLAIGRAAGRYRSSCVRQLSAWEQNWTLLCAPVQIGVETLRHHSVPGMWQRHGRLRGFMSAGHRSMAHTSPSRMRIPLWHVSYTPPYPNPDCS
ncbi:hypothetical protein RRG08_026086 [Elysia crispata]|uniref:Uncharacterized protein n=1 Tax=Elysia crispata TaxID=231223 RepID=A0AAE0YSJ2_9GAST|nr:hypothetical protein RRG08_026086 [Elysia crispata]